MTYYSDMIFHLVFWIGQINFYCIFDTICKVGNYNSKHINNTITWSNYKSKHKKTYYIMKHLKINILQIISQRQKTFNIT